MRTTGAAAKMRTAPSRGRAANATALDGWNKSWRVAASRSSIRCGASSISANPDSGAAVVRRPGATVSVLARSVAALPPRRSEACVLGAGVSVGILLCAALGLRRLQRAHGGADRLLHVCTDNCGLCAAHELRHHPDVMAAARIRRGWQLDSTAAARLVPYGGVW